MLHKRIRFPLKKSTNYFLHIIAVRGLNISQALQNIWIFFSDPTLFYQNLVLIIPFQEYVTKGITHPVFYDDLVYKLRRARD